MATRRRKRSSGLGSTWQTHRALFYNQVNLYSDYSINQKLEKGDCKGALRALHNMTVDFGGAAHERLSMGKKAGKEEEDAFFELGDRVREASDRFEFQCVVGGAFLGLRSRRRRRK